MKGFEDIFPLIAAIIVAAILFLGVTTVVKKVLKSSVKRDTIDSTLTLKEQDRRVEDIKRRQKRLMQDQKQKMRDMQRR